MRSLSRLCIYGVIGFAALAPCASAQERVIQCQGGEVRVKIDIRDVAINYDRPTSVTLAELGPLSYKVSLSPLQLQQIATETQRANEFAKLLIAAYNACAISKQDFREGMFEMSPAFNRTAEVIDEVVAKIPQSQGLSRAEQRNITRVLLTLQKMAELDSRNTQQILLAIEHEQHAAPLNNGDTQIGDIAQNPSANWSSAGLVTFASNLSIIPSNVIVGGSAVLTGASGTQIGDLAQNPSANWSSAGLVTVASNLSTIPSITGGGVIGGLSSTVTGSWTSANSLDQSVSALNAALARSTILSNPNQYEFPSITPSCQLGLCNVFVASDGGSVPVLQCLGSTLVGVAVRGIEINSSIAPAATSCEHEH